MAKATIDRIKEAEEKARALEIKSEEKANSIINNAKADSEKLKQKAIQDEKSRGESNLNKANEKAQQIIKSSEKEAEKLAKELSEGVKKKQSKAVDDIINSVI